jgi:hypothetical protein
VTRGWAYEPVFLWPVALTFRLRLNIGRSWGSTMRNSTVAIIAYALAIGFILAVAFHSPVKFKMAAGAPAPTRSNPERF